MNESSPVVLNIECGVAGLIKINDGVAGEVGGADNKRVITPVINHGTFYVTYLPLASSYEQMTLPLTKRITLGNKINIFENDGLIEVFNLPGVCLVKIKPMFIPAIRGGITPKTYGKFMFQIGGLSFSAGIYQEVEIYIFIEEEKSGRTAFAYPLWFDVNKAETSLHRINENAYLLFEGEGKQGRFAFAVQIKPEFKFINGFLNARGLADEEQLIFKVSEQENGIERNYYYSLDKDDIKLKKEEIKQLKGNSNKKNAAALIFLSYIQKKKRDKALAYLTAQLMDGLSYEDILEFLGDFSKATINSPFGDQKENTVTLWYKRDNNIYDIRMLEFEWYNTTSGNYLIDNISEI